MKASPRSDLLTRILPSQRELHVKAGQYVDIYFQYGGQDGVSMSIPVLDGTYELYAPYAPSLFVPEPVVSPSATRRLPPRVRNRYFLPWFATAAAPAAAASGSEYSPEPIGLQAVVERVDERNSGGDIQLGNRVVTDAIEVFDKGAK